MRKSARIWTLLGALPLVLGMAASGSAAELSTATGATLPQPGLRGSASGGPTIRAKVKSLHELRWENVIRQQLDIGCGAAALATILTYYFDFPSTEEELFQPLLAAALKEGGPDVRDVGFHLGHIRDVAARGGLAAAAFRVEEKNLGRIRIPAIVRITIHGYDHFVVFKEARNGRIYVADPAFGNTSYRLRSFGKIWSGVMMGFSRRAGQRPLDHLLVVRPEDERVIASEEIMRLAAVRESAPTPATGLHFYNISTFPLIAGPRVPGLRSVFPFLLGNRIEF
jgi:predicted double-glycine peptidase